MKNIILIFLFNIAFVQAQTYDFDYFVKYATESSDCKGETAMYVSSKNDQYYLMFLKQENGLTAKLTDYQTGRSHYFTVGETAQKGGKVLYDFKYDFSGDSNFLNPAEFSKNVYSLRQDSANANLELQIYKNSRRKKLESKFSIEVIKSDNLFSAFEYCCVHPHRFVQEEKPKNLLVTKATETTKKGQLINYELKTLKEVNFKLIVPQE